MITTRVTAALAAALAGLLSAGAGFALAQQPPATTDIGTFDKQRVEKAFPSKAPYSPYSGRTFPTRPFFGDTHLHTSYSMDAGAFGARLGPKEAYRFARGEEITVSSGQRAKLSRPLDFLVVADHSDNMGFFPQLFSGDPAMLGDPTGRRWYDMIQGGKGADAAIEIIVAFSQGKFPKALGSSTSSSATSRRSTKPNWARWATTWPTSWDRWSCSPVGTSGTAATRARSSSTSTTSSARGCARTCRPSRGGRCLRSSRRSCAATQPPAARTCGAARRRPGPACPIRRRARASRRPALQGLPGVRAAVRGPQQAGVLHAALLAADARSAPAGQGGGDAMTTTRRRRGPQDGVFKKNGWWWLDYYDQDGRRHRTKASPSYEGAKQLYRQRMTAIARGEVTGIRDEGLRFRDFARRTWLPLAQARHVTQTLEAVLMPIFGERPLARLTPRDVEAWAADRRQQVAPSTFNKNLWVLKNVLNLAQARGYLRHNPAADVERRKEPSGRVRYLEGHERDALLSTANPRLLAYIVVALQTGGRRSELCRLRWTDLDMKQRLLTFEWTKNGERRHVPMSDELWMWLQARPRPLDPAAPVLPGYDDPHSVTRAFDRLVARCGLKNLTFHDLRHDFASRLAMAGIPLLTIGKLLATEAW